MARLLWSCLLVLGAVDATAQEYSYDGNRWYDVEVSIFTNDLPGGASTEIAVARTLTAAYLPRLRELQTPASVFAIPFPGDQIQQDATTAPALAPEALPPARPAQVMGPVYSPAVRDSFKITDFERDPYVDLDARAATFTALNRTLDAAPEHRLLWHKVWRQPMQGRAQTPAVFVSGGDRHAAHTELEGSLRLSDSAGNVMLDINVWLNRFAPGVASESAEWKLPEFPLPLAVTEQEPAPDLTPWHLVEVWQLAQTQDVGANQLYYLDHPAFGVLIEIRPYLLPPRVVAEDQADF